MDRAGILDDPAIEGGNIDAARRQPSLQLAGRLGNLDLAVLQGQGIRLVGRLAAMHGTQAGFAGDLRRTTEASHIRMLRVFDRIDGAIARQGLAAAKAEAAARQAFHADGEALVLDLWREGIRSVVWATGYTRRYPWLKLPVLDAKGEIMQWGGVSTYPGLYVLGLTFLRRRRSSFIDGCGLDAAELAPEIKAYLNSSARRPALADSG
jgi:putative flavoprotein involved in K+ transport